jgi:hypothetical protein
MATGRAASGMQRAQHRASTAQCHLAKRRLLPCRFRCHVFAVCMHHMVALISGTVTSAHLVPPLLLLRQPGASPTSYMPCVLWYTPAADRPCLLTSPPCNSHKTCHADVVSTAAINFCPPIAAVPHSTLPAGAMLCAMMSRAELRPGELLFQAHEACSCLACSSMLLCTLLHSCTPCVVLKTLLSQHLQYKPCVSLEAKWVPLANPKLLLLLPL